MAEKNQQLRINVTASGDPAIEAVYNRLIKGYRDVKDKTSEPFQLSAEFHEEAVLQAARDLRQKVEADFAKMKLRVQAEIDAPRVRTLAGLRSVDQPSLQHAAILQGALGDNTAAIAGLRERAQQQSADLANALKTAFESNLQSVVDRARALGERAPGELDARRRAITSAVESNRPAREEVRNEGQVRDAERERFLKERAGALKSAFESNLPAAAERDLRKQAIEAAKEAGPIRPAQNLSPEDQGLRDAKARILAAMREQALSFRKETLQIESETKARMQLFGETRGQARKAINADERLENLQNARPAGAPGGPTAGGSGGIFGGVFADLRGLFGRYSTLAQAFQLLKASGPFLAFGLAVNETSQITSNLLKMNDAVRDGKKSAGEAYEEFVRTVPVVGQIYSIIEDTREALSGEKADVRRINDTIDESRRRMRDAAEAAGEWADALRDISNQKNLVGLESPAADIERQRQERLRAASDAEQQAAEQIAKVRSPDAGKARNEKIEQNKAELLKQQKALDSAEGDLRLARLAGTPTDKQLQAVAGPQQQIERLNREIEAAEREVSARTEQAQSEKNKRVSARGELDAKLTAQRLRDLDFASFQERLEAERKFDLSKAQLREQSLREAAQHARDEGQLKRAVEAQYQAESLANAAKGADAVRKLNTDALTKMRGLLKGLDLGSVQQVERATFNPATGGVEKKLETVVTPGDAEANRQQFGRIATAGKDFWNQFTAIWQDGRERQRGIDDKRRVAVRDLNRDERNAANRHAQEIARIETETGAQRLRILGQNVEAQRKVIHENLVNRENEIEQEAQLQRESGRGNISEINKRAEEDKVEARKKASADIDHIEQDDNRREIDQAFQHGQEIDRIRASNTANRLRQMGLEFQATRVQREAEFRERVNAIRQQADVEKREHADRAPEIEKRRDEKIGVEAERFRIERNEDVRNELLKAKQSAVLPTPVESRFLSGASLVSQSRLESDLITGTLNKISADEKQFFKGRFDDVHAWLKDLGGQGDPDTTLPVGGNLTSSRRGTHETSDHRAKREVAERHGRGEQHHFNPFGVGHRLPGETLDHYRKRGGTDPSILAPEHRGAGRVSVAAQPQAPATSGNPVELGRSILQKLDAILAAIPVVDFKTSNIAGGGH